MEGWERQEVRLAKRLGGTRRPGSGAFWSAKGDVRSAGLLIEAKYTAKRQITVTAAVLRKIELEAVSESRMPVLAIEVAGRDYIVLSLDDFTELLDVPT
jgi:hypothetical protein